MPVKQKHNADGLGKAFNEIEREDIPSSNLDSELLKLGISPQELVLSVRKTISVFKEVSNENNREKVEEFDPFLIAAGKKELNKRKKPAKNRKKRD